MNRQSVTLPLRNEVTNTNYNEANQMLRFNASSDNMTYDENGNMTSMTNSCGTTNYTWDVRNRLVGINGFNTDCSALSASFKYDALGRRIEKTINGRTIQYLYDGLDIVQEIENGAVSANYIRTLNIDEPLARIKADGTVRYYQADALGSVIGLTDEGGAVKTQYSYDSFGGVNVTGEASDNPFQYTGRENDGTGLYYYRFRYYSPELQRFISEDPIRLYGGKNFFVYVGNNPVHWIDPFGLKGFDPGPNPKDPSGNRDPRTPWLPPNLQNRSKNCPPYYSTSGWTIKFFYFAKTKALLPLVSETEIPLSECKVKIICYYEGLIVYGQDWENNKFLYETVNEKLEFIKTKEGCCE